MKLLKDCLLRLLSVTFIAKAKSARSARCCQRSISNCSSGCGRTVHISHDEHLLLLFVRQRLQRCPTLRLLYPLVLLSGVSPDAAMYVLPIVLILVMQRNSSLSSSWWRKWTSVSLGGWKAFKTFAVFLHYYVYNHRGELLYPVMPLHQTASRVRYNNTGSCIYCS